jgi:hypothetical protein
MTKEAITHEVGGTELSKLHDEYAAPQPTPLPF